MTAVLIVLTTFTLAYINGANDNVKGAATLIGTGLVSPRAGLALATFATALGGVVSLLIAGALLAAFSGGGLVPAALAGSPALLLPVGLAAAATIGLATWARLPVSTTHALVGALVGAGLVSAPDSIVLQAAFTGMAVPLLTVPATAAVLAVLLVPAMRRLRERASVLPDACICVGSPVPADSQGQIHAAQVRLGVSGTGDCPTGVEVATAGAGRALDSAHVLSGTAVSFARGLNDTPKIAAIALAGGALGGLEASVLVVAAMALGGVVAGFRVGDTMAYRMTRMDPAEGMAGNLVAAGLVLAATPLGLPVSTTHVTCGALAGVAAGNRSGRWRTLTAIAVAWVVTLPLAAALAAGLWLLLQSPSNS